MRLTWFSVGTLFGVFFVLLILSFYTTIEGRREFILALRFLLVTKNGFKYLLTLISKTIMVEKLRLLIYNGRLAVTTQ